LGSPRHRFASSPIRSRPLWMAHALSLLAGMLVGSRTYLTTRTSPPDRDVVLPNNNGNPLYVVIDWVATASRTS
jgi:hypothetical protein